MIIFISYFVCSGNPVWHIHGHWRYYIVDTPTVRWNDARGACQKNGADLAIIKSEDEHNFIWDLILKQNTITEYGAWIGLHRKADSKLYWVDDTPLLQGQYSKWRFGQPDNWGGVEGCVHMISADWNDLRCDFSGDPPPAPVILCQKRI